MVIRSISGSRVCLLAVHLYGNSRKVSKLSADSTSADSKVIGSGEFALSSGNVFRWTRHEWKSKGVFAGTFQTDPTPKDFAEADAHVQTLLPGDAVCRPAVPASDDPVARSARIDSFLGLPALRPEDLTKERVQ